MYKEMETVPCEFFSNPTFHVKRCNVIRKLHALFYELLDDARKCQRLSLEIERSCYNNSIDAAEKQNVDPLWDNKRFVDLYCAITYRVISNIDPTSIVCNKELIVLILNGSQCIDSLGSMTSYELMPEKSAISRKQIQKRLTSGNVEGKTSTMYRCKNCGHKEAYIREVQLRSLDEGASISAICKFCNAKWIAA